MLLEVYNVKLLEIEYNPDYSKIINFNEIDGYKIVSDYTL